MENEAELWVLPSPAAGMWEWWQGVRLFTWFQPA